MLIIDDFRDFIDAARNNGTTHLINAIMRDVMQGRYQSILESRDDDLEIVLKCHSNMREIYTLMEVHEPGPDALREIIIVGAEQLTSHHRVPVTLGAIDAALELTSKYHVSDLSLSRAQPERTLNLIDRALTAYRQSAHETPPHLAALQASLQQLDQAMSRNPSPELHAQHSALSETSELAQTDWAEKIARLSALRRSQKSGEELLLALEEQLAEERAAGDKAPAPDPQPSGFSSKLTGAGFGSREEARILGEIREAGRAIEDNKTAFETLEQEMLIYYIKNSDIDAEAFENAYWTLGLQRNFRIIGGFARLSAERGKPAYLDFMPRVWGYLERVLKQPLFAEFAPMFYELIPAPTETARKTLLP